MLYDVESGTGFSPDRGMNEHGAGERGGRTVYQLRYEYIISPVPRDAGTCADRVAPPCPPPGLCVSLLLFVALSFSLPASVPSGLFALIIHALTNPPPMRPGLSPSLQRGFNHSCPHSSEPGWSVDLSPWRTTHLLLLNYAEALTSYRPTLESATLCPVGKGTGAVDWPSRARVRPSAN